VEPQTASACLAEQIVEDAYRDGEMKYVSTRESPNVQLNRAVRSTRQHPEREDGSRLKRPGRQLDARRVVASVNLHAGRVGIELEHPTRGVQRSGQGAGFGSPLTGLTQIHEQSVAPRDLSGSLLGRHVLNCVFGFRAHLAHRSRGRAYIRHAWVSLTA
jgi:hypothetical protein